MSKNNMRENVLKRLKDDTERARADADTVLVDMLETLGYKDIDDTPENREIVMSMQLSNGNDWTELPISNDGDKNVLISADDFLMDYFAEKILPESKFKGEIK